MIFLLFFLNYLKVSSEYDASRPLNSTVDLSPSNGTFLNNYHVCVCVCLFVTPWTVTRQASLSMGFSRQEQWSGLPCPPPGDLPNPGIEPASPALAVGFFTTVPPGKPDALHDG